MKGGSGIRILVGIVIAVISFISYFTSQQTNEVTGERQFVSMSREQEISLGLKSAPEIAREFGGESPDTEAQRRLDQIGERLTTNTFASEGTPWEFNFTVLADDEVINAFALPGGPTFITEALFYKLSEREIAGVMAHEVVHVLGRHGAERLAKAELTNGLVGAVAVASGEASAAQTAAVVGQLINLSYGRDAELESDSIGVCLMIDAGYDPRGMAEVMMVLNEASSGQRPPEFLSTHPNPENRIEQIEETIANADEFCESFLGG
jgi:predicted Zn-dependent protease